MKFAIAIMASSMMFSLGCETSRRPSYDELKSENEQLESQLTATREKIGEAKSNLDELKQQINTVEDEPCHEDSASDLGTKADDVESTLDEADEESN